ncbi:MAG: hypothetical protein JWO94_2408 [Verrucomicrobiaceae bacterium]|nr:hypothetical protein [Verrucomicrobiaceae bacterium]
MGKGLRSIGKAARDAGTMLLERALSDEEGTEQPQRRRRVRLDPVLAARDDAGGLRDNGVKNSNQRDEERRVLDFRSLGSWRCRARPRRRMIGHQLALTDPWNAARHYAIGNVPDWQRLCLDYTSTHLRCQEDSQKEEFGYSELLHSLPHSKGILQKSKDIRGMGRPGHIAKTAMR